MTPELKKRWVDALRSGMYEQGQKTLRSPSNRFCCLGVLCDVVAPEEWQAPDDNRPMGFSHMQGKSMPSDGFLSSIDMPWHEAGKLARMNDDGKGFLTIAEYIEANL